MVAVSRSKEAFLYGETSKQGREAEIQDRVLCAVKEGEKMNQRLVETVELQEPP